jgi:hypothetical protein
MSECEYSDATTVLLIDSDSDTYEGLEPNKIYGSNDSDYIGSEYSYYDSFPCAQPHTLKEWEAMDHDER